jgi:hypothetical protein
MAGRHLSRLCLAGVLALGACSAKPTPQFEPVTPVAAVTPATTAGGGAGGGSRPAGELQIGQSKFFKYAAPPGWHVGEDGQFALTLVAADNQAYTVMVGNAGVQPNYPPDRYAYEKLMALQPQGLQVGHSAQAAPMTGFRSAYAFDVSYSVHGVAMRGVAKVSIAPAYDTQTMAMTAAISAVSQWDGYSSWLPQVADQISATDGGAFGMRGLMAQNLANSKAYAEAASSYRDWSQKNWQQVTDDRNASTDRQNADFRDAIGAVQPYANPFDAGRAVNMPTTHKYYWVDAQGKMVGTDDPAANPNVGSTTECRQMTPVKR